MKILTALVLVLLNQSLLFGQEQLNTDTFSFISEGRRLSGFIDMPEDMKPLSMIVFIPGHGDTDFSHNGYYKWLRNAFVKQGIACMMWDRAGCGKSEGIYNGNQTVQSSADEAIVAIKEIKRRNIPGTSKIGLWSHSRGGYICPLIIQKYPVIAFWISVSGPDGNDSYPYMFESHLRLAGKTEAQIKRLTSERFNASKIFITGGSFEDYIKAGEHLRKDSFCVSFLGLGETTRESYYKEQKLFQKESFQFDNKAKAIIIVPEFKLVLNQIHCPVLAIFGEKDLIVNWRSSLSLYKETIGKTRNLLTLKTFPDGNHSIIKCKTGAVNEDMKTYDPCDGYLDTMVSWLRNYGLGK